MSSILNPFSYTQVLVIVDAKPKALGLPTDAYYAIEEVHDVSDHSISCHDCKNHTHVQDGTPTTRTFEHTPSEIGAEEAEEVGVEHLLR